MCALHNPTRENENIGQRAPGALAPHSAWYACPSAFCLCFLLLCVACHFHNLAAAPVVHGLIDSPRRIQPRDGAACWAASSSHSHDMPPGLLLPASCIRSRLSAGRMALRCRSSAWCLAAARLGAQRRRGGAWSKGCAAALLSRRVAFSRAAEGGAGTCGGSTQPL